MSIIPKIIYFTYKINPPFYVFQRWKKLNPSYNIDFSLDTDCIEFLTEYFTIAIAELFKQIPRGMYKADLWRICKLYINGGVYADVDLVPYVSIDSLMHDNYTYYSCLDADKGAIFQAFMITPPKNPLLLQFIHSFIRNKPWTYTNGPTHDMYNCIKYNLNNINIHSDTLYNFNNIKISVHIGSSTTNVKEIALYNFDKAHEYTFVSSNNNFSYEIRENVLFVTNNSDAYNGWTDNISVDICIKTSQSIYLFEEILFNTKNIVTFKGNKIFDSRDPSYDRNSSFKVDSRYKRYEYLLM
uniref:Alpha 1,4-glycosyltransferase domain-containing protein n=1 Tax=viral metagenome TaxID=1070528 RepID=A0A6C0IHQ6_9ZZZZ